MEKIGAEIQTEGGGCWSWLWLQLLVYESRSNAPPIVRPSVYSLLCLQLSHPVSVLSTRVGLGVQREQQEREILDSLRCWFSWCSPLSLPLRDSSTIATITTRHHHGCAHYCSGSLHARSVHDRIPIRPSSHFVSALLCLSSTS